MAKGGRYLNTNKKEKKKGKGLKILVIILIILALMVGGGYFAFRSFMGSMLGNVNRAELVEQNEDKSYDDLMAELYGTPVQENAEEETDPQVTETLQETEAVQETEATQETAAPEAETTAAG